MKNDPLREHDAHRYETSRPWSVAGLSAAATAAILLLTSGISHAVRPIDGSAVAAQLRLLAQKEVDAVQPNQNLDRENPHDDSHVANLVRHKDPHLPQGEFGTSTITFKEERRSFLYSSFTILPHEGSGTRASASDKVLSPLERADLSRA